MKEVLFKASMRGVGVTDRKRDKVFISYSHKDKKWKEELETMLKPLSSKGKIIYWDDTKIKTGQKWDNEIKNALEKTKIALLLVSANFLASDYIMKKELPVVLEAAEEGKCKIFWMLLNECLYEETGLIDIQAVHDIKKPLAGLKPTERSKILADTARQIQKVYKEEIPPIPNKKKKQIKILSIMASPDDIEGIDYEKEQDTMLDAFRDFGRDEVFLDMPDPFKSTLTEIEDHLKDGKHDILHITAHGGISTEGDGYLCLEDHKGKNHEVSGQLLMNSLVPPPRIVILSACHSARKEPELMPVSQAIFAAGIDIVIGMDKAISHDAAVEFNRAFFKSLCRDETVSQAFEHGKAAIMAGEQQRLRDIPGWEYRKEYDIPHLLIREKDAQLTREDFSAHVIAAPVRPQSHHFFGARFLERGFIGRRQVLRDIHGRIEDQKGAVVLKGPGGIGKSTLTTRMAANLKGNGYDFIVIQGETSPEQILDAISKKAVYNGLKDAESIYAASVDVKEKLNWYLNHFLLKGKFLIIFDNFEENQKEETGDFCSPRLKEFLIFFKEALKGKETFLFFSTRYWLPGFDDPGMTLEISELKANEFRKLLQNTSALKRLDMQSIKKLSQEVGGNPRGLELLDKIAFEEFNLREFTWEQLKALLPELQRRIIEKTGPGDDFTPLYLERLFTYLSESQRNLLDILSIYRNPVPKAAIEAQKASMTKQDRQKLSGLSLLECRETNKERLYYIHRLTAQYMLGKMEKAAALKYHLKAATYFKNLKNEKGKYDLYDLIEARWHYIQAGEWNKAAKITFSLEDYLTLHGFPQWSMELLQELVLEKLDETNRLVTLGRIGSLHQYFGDYDIALEFTQKAYELVKKKDDQKKMAVALHQMGMIYQNKGDYDEALKYYKQSLEIKEKIGDIKGVATSMHQIGMIYHDKGDYEEALKHYQEAKKTFEKIGDIKGVASSFHQIGMIYQDKGDYEQAMEHYQKSLDIKEQIGDIHGLALSYGQMGNLYFDKKEFKSALKYFIKAFQIFSKIGSPNAEKAVKEIAKTREELPSEEYAAILKEFELTPEFIEQIVSESQEKRSLEFLITITSDAMAAKKNNKEKKEEIITQLNQLIEEIEKLPNNDSEPLKSYFQMLLAFVKDENIDAYLKNLPDQLKELFEMAIHE